MDTQISYLGKLNLKSIVNFLIIGGAGFIGSSFIRHIFNNFDCRVLNLDKLTYAGNLESLSSVDSSDRYEFVQADICDADSPMNIFDYFQPDGVMYLAAESNVDYFMDNPPEFIQSNNVTPFLLLEASCA